MNFHQSNIESMFAKAMMVAVSLLAVAVSPSLNQTLKVEMVVYGSGGNEDVFVKAECQVHNDTNIFDMIGVYY